MSQQEKIYRSLEMGTSSVPISITAGTSAGTFYFTSSSTSGSTSVVPVLFDTTLTGTGSVGGRVQFNLNINGASAGWTNAIKGNVTYGSSGKTTGLGSAMSAGTTSGTYAPLESEVTTATGASCGTATSFLYMNNTGTGTTVMNGANGYLFELGSGISDTAGGIFETEANSDSMSMTHVLKIRISGTAYYIPLNTSKAF
jgi:hypothetical protein